MLAITIVICIFLFLTIALILNSIEKKYIINDELIQIFSPGRSSQFSDVIIDTIGVVIGVFLVKLVYRIGQKKSIYKK